jgi:hypothetical protein
MAALANPQAVVADTASPKPVASNATGTSARLQGYCIPGQPINLYQNTTESGWRIEAVDALVLSKVLAHGPGPAHLIAFQSASADSSHVVSQPEPKPAGGESRQAELRWLIDQTELRSQFAGQWVAVQGKSLVAHGDKLTTVLDKCRSEGIDNPFVVRLPEADTSEEVALIV